MDAKSDSTRWILNFYRESEINGAMFFGRLARFIKDPEIKHDMTKHFADESQHAWYWAKALDDMELPAERQGKTYQDAYFEAAGFPMNIMEILALTNVFEKRVIRQYSKHLRTENLHPVIADTISTIMDDEKWHIHWVSNALKNMEDRYGADYIKETIQRYQRADDEVYGKTLKENEEHLQFLVAG